MAVHALLAGIFAQSCVALLPPPQMHIEWFRDGRAYAHDVPLRSSRTERVYRRELGRGAATERVLSCVTKQGVTYMTERIGDSAPVRLPVALQAGQTRIIDKHTVRRMRAPPNSPPRSFWFSVASPGVTVYALHASTGVVEIRRPATSGGVSVLRAVPRKPDPPLVVIDTQHVRALEQRIAELERTVAVLTDSIDTLAGHATNQPYTADQIERLLRAGVPPERVLAEAKRDCIAFPLTPEVMDTLELAGAPPSFLRDLGTACYRTVPRKSRS